jgi:trans-aconitate 2-methyltransferase
LGRKGQLKELRNQFQWAKKLLPKLAQSCFPKQDFPNLDFQVMDARNLVFQDKFERVFSNAALHWIVDQKLVLRGVTKSLKPQGKLLFQMGGKGNAKGIISILSSILTEKPWRQFFDGFSFPYGFFSAEEYSLFLVEAGLKPQRVELFPRDMRHVGAEELAGWIRTTWLPYIERLPNELRDVFIKEIVNLYLRNHPADAGSIIHLGMMRLEVKAYKP